jgi:CRP-like cAMP-binding protein
VSAAPRETQDEVLEALDEVAETAEATAMDARRLQTAVRTSRRLRVQGRSWSEIITREDRPRLVERLSAVLARLSGTGSRLRRAQARALRAEGLTIDQIAELFGVTRQRVSALLGRDRAAHTKA